MQARATTATALSPNPTTPFLSNDGQWITAYLTIHSLSDSSWIYAYILWIAVAVVLVVFSIVHGVGLRSGYTGAIWSRWAIRRRTWRKKHSLAQAAKEGKPYRPPVALPSNAQILTLAAIVVGSLALAYIGPDYFAPGSYPWNVGSTPTATIARRGINNAYTRFQPGYTIIKAWWTSAARTGQIAFALFPLCILLALKAPPFAIFSIPFLTNIHFDKLSWLHRWSGILIWLVATLHVASWSVQLLRDRRPGTGKIAYTYAWGYPNFLFGWSAYGALTFVVITSLPHIRRHFYEAFYVMHVLLVPLMLILAALHHPPVWWWCWIAVGLWIGERSYRLVWFLYNNGIIGSSPGPTALDTNKPNKLTKRPSQKNIKGAHPAPQIFPMHTLDLQTHFEGHRASRAFQYPTAASVNEVVARAVRYTPPLGFVHAELLSGYTVRLHLVAPGLTTWVPGQHFLITIPSISKFTSHPFTCASVADDTSHSPDARQLVFLVRAKKGWTKNLKDTVTSMIIHGTKHPPKEKIPVNILPEQGVLMRALVDGPFGSAARANWGSYSSVLLVAGGSGVSFALAIFELLALCLSGRDGRQLGGRSGGWGKAGFQTSRVRFVWLVREFGHIQWCASALRRCMALVPTSELQVDIYVTNAKPMHRLPGPLVWKPNDPHRNEQLVPPHPPFVQEEPPKSRTSVDNQSVVTSDTDDSEDSDVDLSYYSGDYVDEEYGELGHEEHVLDYTNFDGDDDSIMPGEEQLNLSVRKEGKWRRSYIRRTILDEFGSRPASTIKGFEHTAPAAASGIRLVHPQRPSNLRAITEDIGHGLAYPNYEHIMTPNTPTPTSATGLLTHFFPPPTSPLHFVLHSHISPLPEETLPSRPLSMQSAMTQLTNWSNRSIAALVSGSENVRLELCETELADISVVAERARPGRPKLDRILADEVERSKGAVVVGCCGPTSLNAMIRKHVAALINPERIRQGDMRGSITLIAEDFEY